MIKDGAAYINYIKEKRRKVSQGQTRGNSTSIEEFDSFDSFTTAEEKDSSMIFHYSDIRNRKF